MNDIVKKCIDEQHRDELEAVKFESFPVINWSCKKHHSYGWRFHVREAFFLPKGTLATSAFIKQNINFLS
jgi:hypothetical protein